MVRKNNDSDARDLVTTNEAAEILGLSYYTVYEYIKEGRLSAELVGGNYMLSRREVKQFKPKPTGRLRAKPPLWRVYRAGATVYSMEIEAQLHPDQQERFMEMVRNVREQQQHLFSGTMQRYIFEDRTSPTTVTIQLIWKDTEMPDESVMQREFEAFKADFADVLDWETAQIRMKRGIIYT
jgi:excisionase family DNA binding protein